MEMVSTEDIGEISWAFGESESWSKKSDMLSCFLFIRTLVFLSIVGR
jgi:hypothetical protein